MTTSFAKRLDAIKPSATLAMNARATKLREAGTKVFSFGVGEPDFPTPPHIIEAGYAAAKKGATRYTPVSGTASLRKAVCTAVARDRGWSPTPDMVTVAVGAKHALFDLGMALYEPGDEVIIPAPYWVSYPEQVRIFGAEPVIVDTKPEDGFRLSPEALEAAITPKTKALILCTPSNPTGGAYTEAHLLALAKVLEKHALWIIVDEIYADLVYDGFQQVSLAKIAPQLRDRLVVVDGVSKTFAMTGWRIGWTIAPPALAKVLDTVQSQSTSNAAAISQAAAEAALLGPRDSIEEMRAHFQRRRDLMVAGLNGLPGVTCRTPEGAFYAFADFRGVIGKSIDGKVIETDEQLADYLLDSAHVAGVAGTPFGAPGFLRLSYAVSDDDITGGIAAIGEALAKLRLPRPLRPIATGPGPQHRGPVGYPLEVAVRYLRAKKAASVSVGTFFAIAGVALGVAALATVMSVTGGFQAQFRDKVLGVNAHVLVLKYSSDFREYRDVMKKVESMPGVLGASPFTINPMMVTSGPRTSTGVLLKGVDPDLMPKVLDVPKHVILPADKQIRGLRREGAQPPRRPWDPPTGSVGFPTLAPPGTSAEPPSLGNKGLEKDAEGRPLALMNAIKKAIADADAKKAAEEEKAAANAPKKDPAKEKKDKKDKAADEKALAAAAAPKVVGAIEPDGGYKSVLPDDDLPESVIPDPCGDPAEVAKLPGAVVGVTLAKNLELKLGSCLQVTSPTIGYSYSGGALRPPIAKQFRVVAVFEAGFDQYDSKLVYVDLFEAQAFYDMGDSVTGVEMKVANIDDARAIARAADTRLDNAVYHTMDWEELNHGLFTALRIQQIGMSAVLALIILVAAFTVIATLIMIVLEKRKEIAVLKAMGARDDAILRIFLYQGGIIGLAGTSTGLGLGAALCTGLRDKFPLDPKVYFISRLPVDVRPMEFLLTGAIAIVICLLATIAPALYAAWLKPTDGFREIA